jgi:hypothetical protein
VIIKNSNDQENIHVSVVYISFAVLKEENQTNQSKFLATEEPGK